MKYQQSSTRRAAEMAEQQESEGSDDVVEADFEEVESEDSDE